MSSTMCDRREANDDIQDEQHLSQCTHPQVLSPQKICPLLTQTGSYGESSFLNQNKLSHP